MCSDVIERKIWATRQSLRLCERRQHAPRSLTWHQSPLNWIRLGKSQRQRLEGVINETKHLLHTSTENWVLPTHCSLEVPHGAAPFLWPPDVGSQSGFNLRPNWVPLKANVDEWAPTNKLWMETHAKQVLHCEATSCFFIIEPDSSGTFHAKIQYQCIFVSI